MANVVVIKGEGRAFCAGGDVAVLAKNNQKGEAQSSKDFFGLEYKLDHMIATYKKPYVAFLDGITMGGGVGLSINAPFRIATENTVFAMPETTIGFFPDVGASFFLPRLDGQLGMYLALTSEQIKGPSVFYAGVATHYLHSSSLPDLEARLAELQFNDSDSMDHRVRIVNDTIEEFSTGLPHDKPLGPPVGGNIRLAIDYVFHPSRPDIDSCIEALQGLADMNPEDTGGEEVVEWAKKTRKAIEQRSPTSVRVTFKQLRQSSKWSIAETFLREHGIASRFMDHPDFAEGVTALLVEKRKPNWDPKTLDEVSDKTVQEFFTRLENQQMELIVSGEGADYQDPPYAGFLGLPKETQLESYVNRGSVTDKAQVVDHFAQSYKGKQGVKEKVEEFIARRTQEENGKLIMKKDN